jgi:DNA-binding NtrC family response regulator
MSRIIAVSDNASLLQVQVQALEAGGHTVWKALNMKELVVHLTSGDCDAVKICSTVAPEEKRRILNSVRHYYPRCRVIEVYETTPELPGADGHIKNADEPIALLGMVDQVLAA